MYHFIFDPLQKGDVGELIKVRKAWFISNIYHRKGLLKWSSDHQKNNIKIIWADPMVVKDPRKGSLKEL